MDLRKILRNLWDGKETRATASGCNTFSFGGPNTVAGVTVTEQSALGLTAFSSALTIMAGSVSQLPLKVYQRTANGREARPEHPVQKLLQIRPNKDMTAVMFRDSRQEATNVHGNGYAEIERDRAGRPIAMWPLESNATEPTYSERGDLVYEVTEGDGFRPDKKTLPAIDVLHIPGFGFDGLTGRSIISVARESLGEAQATQGAGAAFWKNGARPTGVIAFPGVLDEEQYKRLKQSWADQYGGSGNTGKPSYNFV